MTMMREMSETQMRETRELVLSLIQGPPIPTSSSREPDSRFSEMPVTYDYDSTPLSAGIEGVIDREEQESELALSLRERAALVERQRLLQAQQIEMEMQNASPGPWNGQDPT
jgi:hypothetical protein